MTTCCAYLKGQVLGCSRPPAPHVHQSKVDCAGGDASPALIYIKKRQGESPTLKVHRSKVKCARTSFSK